ncbi:MAG TPA: SDR family oxidoreductase [Anaerolineae bacterium]|nr:SDR family oxidoreductase [Anaerolineae bacterium]MCB0179287.1 SDR family oxidoreductase [Anaerolineae bacterium]MCB0224614.1 SDR family oxidoreductase [Anaerolineae bacterium]MCB9107210.1 SDR family oxidoreductase [Anaerolineales bacterium]HRV90663.1 SDR family oxidoreductase [Anaerolineae bacterium]
MTPLLKDQVALVTGAGRGIGRAAALALAAAGAAVVLVARSKDEIASVADEIKHQGGKALAIPTDVSGISQIDNLLVLTLRAFGGVDILVNNAAMVHPLGKVWETSPVAWQKLIAVNVIGPYLCARAVLPHMVEKGSGRIINISSGAAQRDIIGASAYNTSKAALERFSSTLAAELQETNIVVTVLRPGIVHTSMQASMRGTPQHIFPLASDWQAWHDQGQLRPPNEPAQAILWLASHFAKNANGQVFSIDDEVFRQQIATDLGSDLLPPRERD